MSSLPEPSLQSESQGKKLAKMFTSIKLSALSAAFLLLVLDGPVQPVGARASPHAAVHAQSTSSSGQYTLADDYFDKSPSHFFDEFDFFDQTSPTSGFVKYLDRATAENSTIIGFVPPQIVEQNNAQVAAYGANPGDNNNAGGISTNNANLFGVYAGIDKQTAMVTNGGRQSVRISSKKSYNPGTLVIAEIAHMPTGCGTWPALWMLGGPQEWPASGEIDIVEQVNDCERNSVTLHTGPGCAIEGGGKNSSGVDYAGDLVTRNCDVNDPTQDKNEGCSIADSGKNTAAPSFGEGFNKAGGGTYITEWATSGITVWFYGASDPEASKTLRAIRAAKNPDPSTFGKPMAKFAGGGCDWGKEFENLKIIINTELCGQWAGRPTAWESSGCKKKTGAETCQQWVQSAKGLEEAYWVFDGLRVYEKE